MKLRAGAVSLSALIAIALQGATLSSVQAQEQPFEEYGRVWGLSSLGVLYPWGAGATGQGAVIAVVDSGIAAGHVDLSGRVLPGRDFVDGDNRATDSSGSSHGTFIAGIAVGNRNGTGIVGTAYNARIIPVRVNDSNNLAPSARVAAGINFATGSAARIINLARAGGPEDGQAVQNALVAAANAGKVVVMPAGNAGGGNPQFPGQYASQMGGHGLIVGSLAPGGGLSGFSNRAGAFAKNYVVAPGESITSTTRNGGYTTSSGTSWATGFASGALALLLGAFPGLSAKDAVNILKSSATDLGAPGVDAVFGHGAINVRRAMAPQGELKVAGDSSSSKGGILVVAAVVVGGALAWNALRNKKELKQTMIQDSFGRGYTADISGMINPRDDGTDLSSAFSAQRMEVQATGIALSQHSNATLSWSADPLDQDLVLRDLRADDLNQNEPDWSMSFNSSVNETTTFAMSRNGQAGDGWGIENNGDAVVSGFRQSDNFSGAHMGFAPRADSVTLGLNQGGVADLKLGMMSTNEDTRYGRISDTAAVEAGLNVTERTRVSLSLSQTTEDGSLLGGASNGPLSVNEATTTAVGVNGRVKLGERFALVGSYSSGRTAVDERPGAMLQDVSTVKSDAWGVGLVGRDVLKRDDTFGVAISRPLRVTSGTGTINVPFTRTLSGDIMTRSDSWNMAPEGKETDLELFYQRPVGPNTRIGAWFLFQDAPFHSEESKDRMSFFATLKHSF